MMNWMASRTIDEDEGGVAKTVTVNGRQVDVHPDVSREHVEAALRNQPDATDDAIAEQAEARAGVPAVIRLCSPLRDPFATLAF